MEERMTALCEKFIENEAVIKKVSRMESSLVYPFAANALCAQGVTADEAKLKECYRIISRQTGPFSFLHGIVTTPFAAYLSMKEDPQAAFERVVRYYAVVKKQFGSSEYSALLSVLLVDLVGEEALESAMVRSKELYRLIKKKHPLLTGGEDSILAGFLALSVKDDAALMDEMEQGYELLKPKFSNKDSIQTVSQILSLTDGAPLEKVGHMTALYDMLKAAGRQFDVAYLAVLAAVSTLDDDNEKLRDAMLEIDGFLAGQKGYIGLFGIDKKSRLTHAAMLTADLYDAAPNAQTAATGSTLAMVAAQQEAICILIASSALMPVD